MSQAIVDGFLSDRKMVEWELCQYRARLVLLCMDRKMGNQMVRCDLGRVYGLSNGQRLNAGFWRCSAKSQVKFERVYAASSWLGWQIFSECQGECKVIV